MGKIRLDNLLVEKGLYSSREKAKAAIMKGVVIVGGKKTDKAGTLVDPELEIKITEEVLPFVSRGGFKLAKALEIFKLDFKDKIVADLGASTGGFTDVSLQNGASKVYAIDVGYGQLAWQLRQDERVVVMERTNARYLEEKDLGELVDIVVTDVSFISLGKIFPAAYRILVEDGDMIALIKPQFEAGKENVGKNGVVSDPKIHIEVIKKVIAQAEEENFKFLDLSFSPIRGPKGNIEYLLYITKKPVDSKFDQEIVEKIVSEAMQLKK